MNVEGSNEPEEIKNLKRMPIQVFTEENLVKVLTDETEKVNLENHYWLSNNTLSKIGALAPNLITLSVRRMP